MVLSLVKAKYKTHIEVDDNDKRFKNQSPLFYANPNTSAKEQEQPLLDIRFDKNAIVNVWSMVTHTLSGDYLFASLILVTISIHYN